MLIKINEEAGLCLLVHNRGKEPSLMSFSLKPYFISQAIYQANQDDTFRASAFRKN